MVYLNLFSICLMGEPRNIFYDRHDPEKCKKRGGVCSILSTFWTNILGFQQWRTKGSGNPSFFILKENFVSFGQNLDKMSK